MTSANCRRMSGWMSSGAGRVVALHSRRIWECQKPRRWKECSEGHPAETYSDDLPSLRPKSYSDMFGREAAVSPRLAPKHPGANLGHPAEACPARSISLWV